jgi:hypothetical protein
MSNKIGDKKINIVKKVNKYPFKLREKLKFFAKRQSFNDLEQNGNYQKKIILKTNIDKLKANKTSVNLNEKAKFPSLKIMNFKKKASIELKIRNIDNIKFNTLKKMRRFSQDHIKSGILTKNYEFKNNILIKKEEKSKEEEGTCNINIEELMQKINKEYSDMGKIIKIKFVLDKDRIYHYEKNEYVLLKIIENDLKENYDLDIKEFILNNQKLDIFRSLKENNIKNNSIISIII